MCFFNMCLVSIIYHMLFFPSDQHGSLSWIILYFDEKYTCSHYYIYAKNTIIMIFMHVMYCSCSMYSSDIRQWKWINSRGYNRSRSCVLKLRSAQFYCPWRHFSVSILIMYEVCIDDGACKTIVEPYSLPVARHPIIIIVMIIY